MCPCCGKIDSFKEISSMTTKQISGEPYRHMVKTYECGECGCRKKVTMAILSTDYYTKAGIKVTY